MGFEKGGLICNAQIVMSQSMIMRFAGLTKSHIVKNCWDELYNYCSRCDGVILREHTLYDSAGDPLCNDCYEDNYDDDCPDNPPVTETDRELVIKLSRSWLQGKLETRRPIFINDKDILLKTIKDKVGLVDNPIYLFGLS